MLLPTTWITNNDNILMPKIWIICRVCLEQHEVMFDIYEKISNFCIWQMLRDCGGVSVRKNDNFPDKICMDCLQELWKSNKFRLKCQRGNRHLINIFLERNFNIYEQDLNEEQAACSEIVNSELPPEEEKDGRIKPLKPIEMPNTNGITSVAKFNKPLKTSEDLKFLDINDDIKIISNTNENKNSEKIEPIEIQSESIKHYYIVQNQDHDKDEQKRIVLLLKVQNETNTTAALKATPKSKTQTKQKPKTQIKNPKNQRKTKIKAQRKPLTKERNKLIDTTKTKLNKNSKIQIKFPTKNSKKKTSHAQRISNVIPKIIGKSTQQIKSENPAKKIKLAIESETATKNIKSAINSEEATKIIKLKKSRTSFSCRICKKSFNTDTLLRHHYYTHTKPYKCRICGKAHSQTHSYKSHYNTHTGEKPFNCRLCPLRFSDASNRNTHERIKHKNEIKEYKCKECNAKFRFRSMLENHKNNHRSTICEICGQLLATHQSLRIHLQRKHLKKLIKKKGKIVANN